MDYITLLPKEEKRKKRPIVENEAKRPPKSKSLLKGIAFILLVIIILGLSRQFM